MFGTLSHNIKYNENFKEMGSFLTPNGAGYEIEQFHLFF